MPGEQRLNATQVVGDQPGSPYTGCGVGRRRGDEEKGQAWRQFPAAQPIGVLRDPRAFCPRHRGADYDHLITPLPPREAVQPSTHGKYDGRTLVRVVNHP
ncbi:hypothetical protein C0Q70_00279 [Pomacea canaliculata]|uniref:Uncharacterized protein n=1 Tax=Pomacea canaliculata TaxID=400727 RepID=A0A2T7PW89_POMCA|nr:hypothetical protein C0Q70_00279 [Pomacea canaliculata]